MSSDSVADRFWAFSIDAYARPGVAAFCLDQQNRAGRDVNLLLWCLFAGLDLGLGLVDADLAGLAARIAPWNRLIIHPLRTVRRDLKAWPQATALRQAVQADELAAERIAQSLLAAPPLLGLPSMTGPGLALTNLAAYLGPEAANLMTLLAVDANPAHPSV